MLTCPNETKILNQFIEFFRNQNTCKINKIVKGLLLETDDFSDVDSKVGSEIISNPFEKGNHLYAGTVSMLLKDDGSVSTKFCITFKSIPSLNGKQIVIGRVVKGLDVLLAVESYGTRFGVPQEAIFIKSSGKIK